MDDAEGPRDAVVVRPEHLAHLTVPVLPPQPELPSTSRLGGPVALERPQEIEPAVIGRDLDVGVELRRGARSPPDERPFVDHVREVEPARQVEDEQERDHAAQRATEPPRHQSDPRSLAESPPAPLVAPRLVA